MIRPDLLNADILKQLLTGMGVPLNKWKWGGTHTTMDALLEELHAGKAQLLLTGNAVSVQVATLLLDVRHKAGEVVYALFEESEDRLGILRAMQHEETAVATMTRVLQHGLGLAKFRKAELVKTKEVRRKPDTYPGLDTVHLERTWRIWIDPEDYKPDGYVRIDGDQVTHFVWRTVTS